MHRLVVPPSRPTSQRIDRSRHRVARVAWGVIRRSMTRRQYAVLDQDSGTGSLRSHRRDWVELGDLGVVRRGHVAHPGSGKAPLTFP